MRYRSIRRLAGTGIVVGGLTMGVLVGGISAAGAATHSPSAATSVLKVAEPPGTQPSSVLPYYTGGQCYTINIDYWNLQYRPGYWFGLGNSITEQKALSTFNAPVIHTAGGKTTATFTIKPWLWTSANAHGQTEVVDAQSVAFWLNMDRAESAPTAKGGNSNTDSCGYSPGLGIPDNVSSVTYPKGLAGNEVVMKFDTSFSNNFMLYNQLSQIQPMPIAWDVTSASGHPGSGHCSSEGYTHVKILHGDACTKVFTFLSKLKLNSKLWDWSDGPYRQSSFGYTGAVANGINTQIANTLYSGPVKAKAVKTISYVPFVSETAEQGQLQSNKLDLGYLDPSDVTASPGPGKAGSITLPRMGSYKAIGTVTFGVFYWNVNFGTAASTNQSGVAAVDLAELNQTYFRQAIQESINQPGVIAHVDNGYATDDYSAIPTYPANPFLAGVHNPFPFSTSAAKTLLSNNGWDTSTATATCSNNGSGAGQCGAGIPHGAQASVWLETPSGDPTVTEQVNEEVATIQEGGININLNTQDQNTVGGVCFAGQTSGVGAGGWDLCNYGGWIFAPDYYPSGEVLFLPGAGSNDGGLNDPTMNGLIHETDFGTLGLNQTSPTYHTSYAQYSATSVPFIWQPTPAGFGIDIKTIKGSQPPNALGDFNPEYITAI